MTCGNSGQMTVLGQAYTTAFHLQIPTHTLLKERKYFLYFMYGICSESLHISSQSSALFNLASTSVVDWFFGADALFVSSLYIDLNIATDMPVKVPLPLHECSSQSSQVILGDFSKYFSNKCSSLVEGLWGIIYHPNEIWIRNVSTIWNGEHHTFRHRQCTLFQGLYVDVFIIVIVR